MDDTKPSGNHSSLFSIPLLCIGLCMIGVCVLAPQIESNRKLAIERDRMKRDLASVETQLAVNEEFISRVGNDADLAERLAQRQMKQIRQGARVLELDGKPVHPDMSPFMLLSVPPPRTPAAYIPPPGILGRVCVEPRTQLYAIGIGMFLVACGLVIGTEKTINGDGKNAEL